MCPTVRESKYSPNIYVSICLQYSEDNLDSYQTLVSNSENAIF